LRAVSSSLSDCNSSLDVNSSSFVDWYSSLTDNASSLTASARRSKSQGCECGLELCSGGFEFLLKFGDPYNVPRRDEVTSFLPMFGLVNEANQQQLLAFAQNWLYGDAEQIWMAIVVCMGAGNDNARVLLTGRWIAERACCARPHAHGEQIVCGMTRGDAQVRSVGPK